MNTSEDEKSISRPLVEYCLNHVADLAEERAPETGRFVHFGTQFYVGDEKAIGMICVECDDRDRDKRYIVISTRKGFGDRLWSHVLFRGSTDEVLAKLRNPATVDEAIQSLAELYAKVLEH